MKLPLKLSTTQAVIGGIVLLLIIIVIVNWNVWFAKEDEPADGAPNPTGGAPTGGAAPTLPPVSSGLNTALELKVGSRGEEVKWLQKLLNGLDSDNPLTEDGNFGAKTKAKLYYIAGVNSTTLADAAGFKKPEGINFWKVFFPLAAKFS
ncbi:MAG: peptidoglycan-binding protein [Chitinophagia bacterium]|nr:peptidoglycan-binding protein [Chitinophagia bacterium]